MTFCVPHRDNKDSPFTQSRFFVSNAFADSSAAGRAAFRRGYPPLRAARRAEPPHDEPGSRAGREAAGGRAARVVAEIRQQLLSRLERIKLEEVTARAAEPDNAPRRTFHNPAVMLVG